MDGRPGAKTATLVGVLVGRRGGDELECGRCGAPRDAKDLFCGRCGEDFTGSGEPMVLEPHPPGGDL